jgi:hypothetical protein
MFSAFRRNIFRTDIFLQYTVQCTRFCKSGHVKQLKRATAIFLPLSTKLNLLANEKIITGNRLKTSVADPHPVVSGPYSSDPDPVPDV